MENIFLSTEDEVIENFKKQNPTKEDYYDIISESDPEFLSRIKQSQMSSWDDNKNHLKPNSNTHSDGFKEEIDSYECELPSHKEITLYDHQKTFEENFSNGESEKYILLEVTKSKKFFVGNPEFILPSPQSKCLVDINEVEKHNDLDFIVIDYDTFFGLRLSSFIGYTDFFLCDERVIFEALLMKYKYFDFKPFYWSKEVILKEVGIKKDRSAKILDRFSKLGILTTKVEKSFINNRPGQITYFNLDSEKILELAPKIYKERDNISIESKLKQYLLPSLGANSFSKMQ